MTLEELINNLAQIKTKMLSFLNISKVIDWFVLSSKVYKIAR